MKTTKYFKVTVEGTKQEADEVFQLVKSYHKVKVEEVEVAFKKAVKQKESKNEAQNR